MNSTTAKFLLSALALLTFNLFVPNLEAQTFGYTGTPVAYPTFHDISGTGSLIASGDDTGGVAALGGAGFTFFGVTYNSLFAATNGYLSTNLTDGGPDLSNDSFLPTVPSTGGGGRIYPLHDDLISDVYHQYFTTSPYTNPNGSAVSGNFFQWDNTTHFGGGGPFDFQAVLFDDGNILFVYGPGNPELGSGSTTGIQNPAADDGYLFASNTNGSIPENFALFIKDPNSEPEPEPEPTYLITNAGAINSLQTTGLLMPGVQQQAVQNAAQNAVSDLNNRLFRARAYGSEGKGSGFASTIDAPISRYLNFAARNQIDYRVAIGLREEAPAAQDTLAAAETLWLSSPFALLGGPIAISAPSYGGKAVRAAPSGEVAKNPLGGKVIIDEQANRKWEVFTDVDYGYYDQNNLNALVRGFRSDSYSGTVGAEYRLLPWLYAGGAVTGLTSHTDIGGNLGSVDLEGTLLSTYFTAYYKEFYFDFLYSYGNFRNDLVRNTMLGGNAFGSTDSYSENVDLNIGYTHQLTDQIRTGPFAGFNYMLGKIDGYTESGGGAANLIYNESDIESMIGRLGWQISAVEKIPAGRITVQASAAFVHNFRPEANGTQVSLLNTPFTLVNAGVGQSVGGFGATSSGVHAGADWLELGTGVRLDLENQWNVSVDYSGQFFRENASAHMIGARIGYEW
ncbi:autotransporter outer membrane beta-barrel domain-containing protein [Verrucomicrobiales bacterium BCK34]|nr:autotransporter outer membrane beta-barrel domain-containing protein [Verrucomicrobiales bacterium BCK34]